MCDRHLVEDRPSALGPRDQVGHVEQRVQRRPQRLYLSAAPVVLEPAAPPVHRVRQNLRQDIHGARESQRCKRTECTKCSEDRCDQTDRPWRYYWHDKSPNDTSNKALLSVLLNMRTLYGL